MEMIVHLHPDVFSIVKNGVKDVEVRINDEKRRKLNVGDTLIFLKRPNEDESLKRKVKALKYYDSFSELLKYYEMKRIYLDGYTEAMYLEEMRRFYTEDEEKKYGVVAIIFE